MSLAGRAHEVTLLRSALDGGSPIRAVEIVGDPGIGKSRLLAELAALGTEVGRVVLTGRAAEFERHVPFGMFVNALDDHLASCGEGSLAQLGAGQLALLGAAFPSLGGYGDSGLIGTERYRLYRAVRALLASLAGPVGMVLILDDVHWADEGSVELLDHLLRHPPRAQVLVALASRPRQTSARLWHTLSRSVAGGVAELMELAPLTPAEADILVPAGLPSSRRAAIHLAGAGNPFYLEALVRAAESGVGPGKAMSDAVGLVPVAVRAALSGELAALSATELTVAHAAAVAQDDFDATLLSQTAGLDLGSVLPALDVLAGRDLVRPAGPVGRWRYRHPLVRSVAYQDAGPAWRQHAHRRAAAALRTRGVPAVELAHHVERSAVRGDLAAVGVLAEAAEATMNAAPATAAHFLEAALALLPPDGSVQVHRLRLLGLLARALGGTGKLAECRDTLHEVLRLLPAASLERRAQAARFYAMVELLLGSHAQARAVLLSELSNVPDSDPRTVAGLAAALAGAELMALHRDTDRDWPRVARQAARRAGEAPLLATSLALSVLDGRATGAAEETLAAWLDEAARLLDGEPVGDAASLVEAALWLSLAEIFSDRLADAGRHLDRGLTLARGGGPNHMIGHLTAVRGIVYGFTGDLPAAAATFEDALETALLSGSGELRSMALAYGSWVTALRGDVTEAVTMGRDAVAASAQAGPWQAGRAQAMLGLALLHAGDPDACIALTLSAGGGPGLPAADRVIRPRWYQVLAEAEMAAGRPAQAAGWADLADAAAAGLGLPLRAASARMARATAVLPTDPVAATIAATDAVTGFTAAGMNLDAGRAHLLAGTAFGSSGEFDRAAWHFQQARALLTACGAQLLLPRVTREERRLNARRPRATDAGRSAPSGLADRYGLTAREADVAALVAAGLINREIGRRLHLSPKTIEVYLSRVCAKLDVSGRAAVAAKWAGQPAAFDLDG